MWSSSSYLLISLVLSRTLLFPLGCYKNSMSKSTWFDQLQQLLGGKGNTPVAQQLVHEPLVRSQRFEQELQLYVQHQEATHLELLRQNYQLASLQPGSVAKFVVLNGEHAAGFMWYAEAAVPEKHYDFMLDRLSRLVAEQGYVEQQNERKIWPVGESWQELQKRYLKPKLRAEELANGLVNQRFGNVLLETLRRDGQLKYLKLQCNVYQDHQYTPAQSFERLMELVLAGGAAD